MSQTSTRPPEVDRFLGLAKKFADVADNPHFTTVAYRSGDEWSNLGTIVTLGGPPSPENSLEVTRKLLVLSKGMSIEEAVSLVSDATLTGMFSVEGKTLRFAKPASYRLDQRMERLYFYTVRYEPGSYYPILLSMTGPTTDEIVGRSRSDWEALDEALQQSNPPYLGLQDLAESHLGYPLGQSYSAMMYALLLLPVRVLEADIGKDGSLQLKLRRDPRIRKDDVIVGAILKREGGVPTRASVPLTEGEVLQSGEDWEIVRFDIPTAGYSMAVIQLRVRDEIQSSTRLYPGVSSPRLRCHRILDPDGAHLEKALTKKGGTPFEEAVAMLLHLAGFKVEATSVLETLTSSRYADILAFTPDEQTVLIGACVFKNPSPQDITLLAQSALTTKEVLDNANSTIAPVIFTAMSEKTVSQSLSETAQRENIRIVPREALHRILALVKTGAGPSEIMQVIERGYIWPWLT